MTEYVHTVQYYETDKMGITHHSNYIRWMEEARVDFLEKIGWDFAKLESLGVVSPVVSISCDYKHPTIFAERVIIEIKVLELRASLKFGYEMKNQEGVTVCRGTSQHVLLNTEGKMIRTKKEYPGLYEALSAHLEVQNEG